VKRPAPNTPILASPEALFRSRVVSLVLADLQRGYVRAEAVDHAATSDWWTPDGVLRRVSERTVYRWLRAYERDDLAGLEPASRDRTDSSVVLSEGLLSLLAERKRADPTLSIPELLRIARELGVIGHLERVDRTTVYRAARRLGLPVKRRKKSGRDRDMRRFAYPHRMDCNLCDGKHFRAGVARARRVALFFLDDATRLGLEVVVGTAECAELFLRGLYEGVLIWRKPGERATIPIITDNWGGSGWVGSESREAADLQSCRRRRSLIFASTRWRTQSCHWAT